MKREEMDLDLRIHNDNMHYKFQRDQKVLETARLALLNQGVVVAAMASLANAIRRTRPPPTSAPISSTPEEEEGTTRGEQRV